MFGAVEGDLAAPLWEIEEEVQQVVRAGFELAEGRTRARGARLDLDGAAVRGSPLSVN